MGGFLSGRTSLTTVQTANLAANAVTTAKILDDAVTGAKLNPALVQGDIIYADGTDTINRLAKGTASQTLQMNGGATAPNWVTAAAAGWEFIEASSPSGASSVTFSHTVAAGYDYLITCRDMLNNANISSGNGPVLQYGTGATPTFQTSGYDSHCWQKANGQTFAGADNDVTTGIQALTAHGYGDSSEPWTNHYAIFNPGANERTYTVGRCACVNSDGNFQSGGFEGYRTTAEVVTAFKIIGAGGTWTGEMTLSRRKVS